MIEYGARTNRLPAPPHVVWESLTQPHRPSARSWLHLEDDEVQPRVLEAEEPSRLLWSSLWPDRPDDRVELTLRRDGTDTRLGYRLLSPDAVPDDAGAAARRRMSVLLYAELRYSYGA